MTAVALDSVKYVHTTVRYMSRRKRKIMLCARTMTYLTQGNEYDIVWRMSGSMSYAICKNQRLSDLAEEFAENIAHGDNTQEMTDAYYICKYHSDYGWQDDYVVSHRKRQKKYKNTKK